MIDTLSIHMMDCDGSTPFHQPENLWLMGTRKLFSMTIQTMYVWVEDRATTLYGNLGDFTSQASFILKWNVLEYCCCLRPSIKPFYHSRLVQGYNLQCDCTGWRTDSEPQASTLKMSIKIWCWITSLISSSLLIFHPWVCSFVPLPLPSQIQIFLVQDRDR